MSIQTDRKVMYEAVRKNRQENLLTHAICKICKNEFHRKEKNSFQVECIKCYSKDKIKTACTTCSKSYYVKKNEQWKKTCVSCYKSKE